MAEGVNGKIDLKISKIAAVGCDDDVVETNPSPSSSPWRNGGGRNRDGGGFGGGRSHTEFVGNVIPEVLSNGDVRIEAWPNPRHAWYSVNDPVMGGQSTSTVTAENDVGVFEGEVVDVPFLQAPGFIKMETRGGEFPDVSHCRALKLGIKKSSDAEFVDYDGLHVTFGVHHAEGAMPYIRGYKAPLTLKKSSGFQEVVMPFTDFSDSWDSRTGDVEVKCKDNSIHCPDDATLRYMTTLSIMGEGKDGKVRVEVKSIDATDCDASYYASQQEGGGSSSSGSGSSVGRWIGLSFGFVCVAFVAFVAGRSSTGLAVPSLPTQPGLEMGDEPVQVPNSSAPNNPELC